MSDPYLWEKRASAEPDASEREVREMERLLARYRYAEMPVSGPGSAPAPRWRMSRTVRGFAAAAAAIAALFLVARLANVESDGYRVDGIQGVDLLRPGDEIATGSRESASLRIGWLGRVELAPNSRLRV